jgi:hypothetical protein
MIRDVIGAIFCAGLLYSLPYVVGYIGSAI